MLRTSGLRLISSLSLDGWKDIQSVKSASLMLYLELTSFKKNDERHKMNANSNRPIKRPIYQLPISFGVMCIIMQLFQDFLSDTIIFSKPI